MRHLILLLAALALGPSPSPAPYTVRSLPLPGGGESGISMDYIAYDPATGFVWVPAGNTGAVDVVDTRTGKVTQVTGFPTREVEMRGAKRTIGPSAVTIGAGTVYIGSRGDSSICALDARTLERRRCGKLDAMPDGLAYVASSKEVWATTPRDKSVRVLDAATLTEKAKVTFEGAPEGFAVDAVRGRFYTNLEDKDRTVAVDIASRKTVATWNPACGEEGPRGLRLDDKAGFLFVACTASVKVLDVAHEGAVLSSIDTGAGVDDFDYVPATREVYVGAARAAQLTIARVDAKGHLALVARVPTREGARNGVVAADGTVYLAHGGGVALSELVVVSPPAK